MKSRNLKYTIKGSGGLKAEISGLTKDNYPWRHAVDLENNHVHVVSGIFLGNLTLML